MPHIHRMRGCVGAWALVHAAIVAMACGEPRSAGACEWHVVPTAHLLVERAVEERAGVIARWRAEFAALVDVQLRERAHPSLITVVVPVRNGAAHVGRALRSVLASARQVGAGRSGTRVELIVVDDASTDDTGDAVCAALAVGSGGVEATLLRNPARMGAALSRNVGVFHARGEVVCFLDADDMWMPDHLPIAAEHSGHRANASVAYLRTGVLTDAPEVKPGGSAGAGQEAWSAGGTGGVHVVRPRRTGPGGRGDSLMPLGIHPLTNRSLVQPGSELWRTARPSTSVSAVPRTRFWRATSPTPSSRTSTRTSS